MAVKHLSLDMDHNVIERKQKVITKPKLWDDTWTKQYWLERDRVIYKTCDEESKQQILERYGKA